MIAFLIDADNLSNPAWIHTALEKLSAEGNIAIRRAYGSPENLKGLGETMRTWAIRPYVNASLSKNTTDLSLAVDAMFLACQTPAPSVIAIGSGDADFVPLVMRLRELGIKVICISEQNKMSAEAIPAYDAVMYVVDHAMETPSTSAASASKKKKAPAAKTATNPKKKKVASKPTDPSPAIAATTPASKPAATKTPARKTEKKPTSTPNKTPEIDDILAALTELKTDEWMPLGNVVKILRDKKLLGKNAATTKFFAKFPSHFELTPEKQPNQLRLIATSR